MIFPIGHESNIIRRKPWISFFLIGICFVIHIFTHNSLEEWEPEFRDRVVELGDYYVTHPYLKLSPEIEQILFKSELIKEEIQESLKKLGKKKAGGYISGVEQTQLERLERNLKRTIDKSPLKKWGVTPSDLSFLMLFTYMFLHTGLAHLIGNMYILYLTGPFIEDIWGRSVFTAFYLLSGIVSVLLYSMIFPHAVFPVIGASGAISGLMGAFLIKYWKTRILFFNLFFFWVRKWRMFTAPAWLMLPLWLLFQILGVKLMDVLKMYGGGPVAYWAHIWGFVFGVAVAIGMKLFRFEERFTKKQIEKKSSMDKNSRTYEEAMKYIGRGEKGQAYKMLREAAREAPTHPELVHALWKLSLEFGNERETAEFLVKLIGKEVKDGHLDSALFHYRELNHHIPDGSVGIDIHSKVMLAEYLVDIRELREGEILAHALIDQIDHNFSPSDLLYFVQVLLKLDLKRDLTLAGIAIQRALLHPGIPPEKKEELKSKLYKVPSEKKVPVKKDAPKEEKIQSEGITPPAQGPDAVEVPGHDADTQKLPSFDTLLDEVELIPAPPLEAESIEILTEAQRQGHLVVTPAVPVGIEGSKLLLEMEHRSQKVLPLEEVHSISVVKISSTSERPFFLIDLFLIDPKSENSEIRTIRFTSKVFDPRRLVPGAAGPMEANRIFMSILLKLSGAKPYPDLESVLLQTVREFPSVKAYEDSFPHR